MSQKRVEWEGREGSLRSLYRQGWLLCGDFLSLWSQKDAIFDFVSVAMATRAEQYIASQPFGDGNAAIGIR